MTNRKKSQSLEFDALVTKYLAATNPLEKKFIAAHIKKIKPDWEPVKGKRCLQ